MYFEGDSTVAIEVRKANALAVQEAFLKEKEDKKRALMTRAMADHMKSLNFQTVAEYKKFMDETDPATGKKRAIPTVIGAAAVSPTTLVVASSKKRKSSSFSHGSLSTTSSSIKGHTGLFSYDEIASLLAAIETLVVNGPATPFPLDSDLFKRVRGISNNCAYVYGTDWQRVTIADRDFFVDEVIIVNWDIVKLGKGVTPPAGSFFLGEDVYVSPPDSGDNPNYPYSSVMCAPEHKEKDCNLVLMANSTLTVTRHIAVGDIMRAYYPPAVSNDEISFLVDFALLRMVANLILDCEFKVWQLIRFKFVMNDVDVQSKYPEIDEIDSCLLNVMSGRALISHFLDLFASGTGERRTQFMEMLDSVTIFDKSSKVAKPLLTTMELTDLVQAVTSTSSSSSSSATLSPLEKAFNGMTVGNCLFLRDCLHLSESSYGGYSLDCCDKVYDLFKLSLVQRYSWFKKIQEFCTTSAKNQNSAPTINMVDRLIQRQCDFMLADRVFIPSLPVDSEKSFHTFEYQYTDPLPVDFESRVLVSVPRPVVQQKKSGRGKGKKTIERGLLSNQTVNTSAPVVTDETNAATSMEVDSVLLQDSSMNEKSDDVTNDEAASMEVESETGEESKTGEEEEGEEEEEEERESDGDGLSLKGVAEDQTLSQSIASSKPKRTSKEDRAKIESARLELLEKHRLLQAQKKKLVRLKKQIEKGNIVDETEVDALEKAVAKLAKEMMI